jgi:DNA-binding response OmpR family regulator
MKHRRILTVEDDSAIRRGIVDALSFAGFEMLEAPDGDVGLELAIRAEIDLLLLDLVLPGKPGLEILQEVRVARPMVPIIILSARGEENDRVQGLRLGADDYVVKPFSVRELLARVDAVLRRTPERPTDVSRAAYPGGCADFERRELRFADGTQAELSEREAELLRYLMINSDRAVARDELLANVWRISPRGAETRTIDMHIARLREKLRDDPTQPRIVLTVRGKGYKFCRDSE